MPFWWEAWPSPPKRFPKSPPCGRLRSAIPTRGPPGWAARYSVITASTIASVRPAAQRRQGRLGACFSGKSQVKKSVPSDQRSVLRRSQRDRAGVQEALLELLEAGGAGGAGVLRGSRAQPPDAEGDGERADAERG